MKMSEIFETRLVLGKGMMTVPTGDAPASPGTIKLSGFKGDDSDPEALEDFLQAWKDMTLPNPMNHRQRVFDEVGVAKLSLWGKAIQLDDLRSMSKGGGAATLTAICELADRFGVTIELYASGYAHTPTDKLVFFYERFGFVAGDNDGNGVDMERQPR